MMFGTTIASVVRIVVAFADCHESEPNTEQNRRDCRLFRSWHVNDCARQKDIWHSCHVLYGESGDGDENDDVFALDGVADNENATTADPERGWTRHQ